MKGEQQDIEVIPKTDDRAMLDLDQLTTHIRLSVSKLFGSFIAVELRSWLAKEMSIYTPLLEFLQSMSTRDLVVFTHKELEKWQSQTEKISSPSHVHPSVEMETDLSLGHFAHLFSFFFLIGHFIILYSR